MKYFVRIDIGFKDEAVAVVYQLIVESKIQMIEEKGTFRIGRKKITEKMEADILNILFDYKKEIIKSKKECDSKILEVLNWQRYDFPDTTVYIEGLLDK